VQTNLNKRYGSIHDFGRQEIGLDVQQLTLSTSNGWSLPNGRIFGDENGEPHDGVPNGIKVDEQGDLFVTGPQGIWVWDAQRHNLATMVMPEHPTNLA